MKTQHHHCAGGWFPFSPTSFPKTIYQWCLGMRGVHADTFGKRLGSHLLQSLDYPSASPANASPWYLSHVPAISCKPLTGSLKGANRFPDSSSSWGKEMCVSAEARDENCVFSSGVALRGKKRKKRKKNRKGKQTSPPTLCAFLHFKTQASCFLVQPLL